MAAIRADRWRAYGHEVKCEGRLIATTVKEEDARYLAVIHNAILPLVNQLVMWYNKLRDKETMYADAIDFDDGDEELSDATFAPPPPPARPQAASRPLRAPSRPGTR